MTKILKKSENKKTVKTQKVSKKAAKKTIAAVAPVADVNPADNYKQSMIAASQAYIARRIAAEGDKLSAAKRKEIEGLNLAGAVNASFEVLQKANATPELFDNLRLTAYAKALQRSVIVLNAIATGNYTGRYNCLAGALIDLKRACINAGLYSKKELSFSAYSGGRTGGASPAASMLGIVLDIFQLGDWDNTLKVVKVKPLAIELISKMTIQSPLFYSK